MYSSDWAVPAVKTLKDLSLLLLYFVFPSSTSHLFRRKMHLGYDWELCWLRSRKMGWFSPSHMQVPPSTWVKLWHHRVGRIGSCVGCKAFSYISLWSLFRYTYIYTYIDHLALNSLLNTGYPWHTPQDSLPHRAQQCSCWYVGSISNPGMPFYAGSTQTHSHCWAWGGFVNSLMTRYGASCDHCLPGDWGASRQWQRCWPWLSPQYTVQDQILEPDSTLKVIPPASKQGQLFQEAHEGVFGGHLMSMFTVTCTATTGGLGWEETSSDRPEADVHHTPHWTCTTGSNLCRCPVWPSGSGHTCNLIPLLSLRKKVRTYVCCNLYGLLLKSLQCPTRPLPDSWSKK